VDRETWRILEGQFRACEMLMRRIAEKWLEEQRKAYRTKLNI